MHLQALDVGQARVPGAEVIHRHLHAVVDQGVQHRQHLLGLAHDRRFGDLEFESIGREPGMPQDGAHLVDQIGADLLHRQVDGHARHLEALRLPGDDLAAGLVQHPATDFVDDADLLGQGDELRRRHQAQLGMTPARESLHGHHPAGAQVDLGLIVQAELVARQGVAQRVLEQQALKDARGQGRLEELIRVAPARLGFVEGAVGVHEQGIDVRAVAGVQADADAGRHHKLVAADHDRLRDATEQILSGHHGALRVDLALEQEHEPVAAQTRHRVAAARRLAQAPGELEQQLVAHRMAQRLVDVLEPVEVEHQHGQVVAVVLGSRDRVRAAIAQQQPVGQAREGVVMAQEVDLRLRFLDQAEVGEDRDVLDGLAGFVAHGAQGEPLGIDIAVLAPVPDLAAPFAVRLQRAPHLAVEDDVVPP